jgi:hypothetical protein
VLRDDETVNRAVTIATGLGIESGVELDLAVGRAKEMLLDGFSEDEVRIELRRGFARETSREFFASAREAGLYLAAMSTWFGAWVFGTVRLIIEGRPHHGATSAASIAYLAIMISSWVVLVICIARIYRYVTGTWRGFMTRWGWQRQVPLIGTLRQAVRMLGPTQATATCVTCAAIPAILGAVAVA